MEILHAMAAMLPTEEIAASMFVSVNTVKTHVRSILPKLSRHVATRPCAAPARSASSERIPRRDQIMCRWLAYSGSPILLEEVLYKPRYSLIDQSMHSRMGVETTNGDGFGIAWY